jgi:hypothetical protein
MMSNNSVGFVPFSIVLIDGATFIHSFRYHGVVVDIFFSSSKYIFGLPLGRTPN